MSQVTVKSLYTYPVKSCAGKQHNQTTVADFGLAGDRQWMVVDDKGVMLTQRKYPAMCLIHVDETANGISLSASGAQQAINITKPVNSSKVRAKVWNDECSSYDAGDEVANWLSQFLKTKCRLVYFPDDEFRQVDLEYAKAGDKTAFSDGFPLLLISQASLDDLNKRLDKPIGMERFRPNLVVEGCDAFAEDDWKQIRIGEINFRLVKPCSRCIIPSINPATAALEKEPLITLKTYRQEKNKIFFGQNIIADGQGMIRSGMQVEIIE